jgi:hypothetical protein
MSADVMSESGSESLHSSTQTGLWRAEPRQRTDNASTIIGPLTRLRSRNRHYNPGFGDTVSLTSFPSRLTTTTADLPGLTKLAAW